MLPDRARRPPRPKAKPKVDPPRVCDASVQEMHSLGSPLGELLYVKIRRHDEKPMSWSEVCAVFNDRYPDRWAVQFFPPADRVVDEVHCYHLYVMTDPPPRGVDICRR